MPLWVHDTKHGAFPQGRGAVVFGRPHFFYAHSVHTHHALSSIVSTLRIGLGFLFRKS